MARILHVLHSYLPNTRGGIEHHVESLASAQSARGDEVFVACGGVEDGGGDPAGLTHEVGNGEPVGPVTVWRLGEETDTDRARAGGRSATLERYDRLLAHLQPDLVHVHHFAATGPGLVARARALSIATIVTLHDLHAICPLFFRLRANEPLCAPEVDAATCVACLAHASGSPQAAIAPWFDARTRAFRVDLEGASRVLAPSRAAVEYLAAVPSLSGIEVRSIGFPRGGEPAARARFRDRAGEPLVVATWGGLVPGKGLGLLIDAAAMLARGAVRIEHHGPEIDRDFARACIERAQDAGVALRLHGPYAREELARRLADVDVAVHPSSFLETYGLTLDEAHAVGLPVVVSDRGAPKERLGGRGVTFRADDAADLARVLMRLVDPRERARLADGAPPALLAIDEYVRALQSEYDGALRASAVQKSRP